MTSPSAAAAAAPAAAADAPWPSFRGARAEGIASDQQLPAAWNGTTGEHVKWKVRVPGLAHSSPIVWGDRVFVATAVSSLPDATFKPGSTARAMRPKTSRRTSGW